MFRPRRLAFTMRTREMLLCAAGSIFNDLCKRMFSFCLLFFMEVMELSAADTGLIILIGQVVDSLASVISGYLGDMVKVPVLSQKILTSSLIYNKMEARHNVIILLIR